jgi:hypothetical protein
MVELCSFDIVDLQKMIGLYRGIEKFIASGFFTEFSSIFFRSSILMDILPFVFYHSLEPVDPCFEDSYEGFLSVFQFAPLARSMRFALTVLTNHYDD